MCLAVNYKLYYKTTLQMPGLRGSFKDMLVSHRNPVGGNSAETDSQALGAPL